MILPSTPKIEKNTYIKPKKCMVLNIWFILDTKGDFFCILQFFLEHTFNPRITSTNKIKLNN